MTNTACNAISLAEAPYLYSCAVPVLASNNSTNTSALLQSCCPQGSPVEPYPASVANASCYLYCNTSTQTAAKATYSCLVNLGMTDPSGSSGLKIFGCATVSAGARMSWSSVGVLLVVGVWAIVSVGAGVM